MKVHQKPEQMLTAVKCIKWHYFLLNSSSQRTAPVGNLIPTLTHISVDVFLDATSPETFFTVTDYTLNVHLKFNYVRFCYKESLILINSAKISFFQIYLGTGPPIASANMSAVTIRWSIFLFS